MFAIKYNICAVSVIFLITAQIIFWAGLPGKQELWPGTNDFKPKLGIVPPLPSKTEVQLFLFGDPEWYFRFAGYQIQNAGDTFGRSTSLKKYDYSTLKKWWLLLDELNSRSHYVPSMASYYFGATPDDKQIPFVVDYLEQFADRDPARNWWWYSQAIYHAKYRMDDLDRALRIAKKLAAIPKETNAPIWVRQMQAFILEDKGEYQRACEIILNILDTYKDLKPGELNFIKHFIEERIAAMRDIKESDLENIDPRCKAIVEIAPAKHSP